MIAIDTNVLVRYLVRDDEIQANRAQALLESLSYANPAFLCREVLVELTWILERAYSFSRDGIATTLENLVATEGIAVEEAQDVTWAASRYRVAAAGFADFMVLAASERMSARPLYTFDRKAARIDGIVML